MSVLLLLLTLTIDEAALRTGESVNGFPSWEERVVHQWINRARVEPQTDLAKCGAACADKACYAATAPLFWSEALNRAARFHASEMQKQNYFDHDSKCTVVNNISTLYPTACDGSASCACSGGSATCTSGCTSWAGRIGLFGGAPEGEIIAIAPDPNSAFYLWLLEPASQSVCGFNGANGHRWLVLQASNGLGAGVSGLSSVVDFGNAGAPSRIASAAHYPRQAASLEVWANWFDVAAPRSASVVVDGTCMPMTLRRGTQTNGAWSATVTGMGSGCHRYYVSFVDASGAEVTWPATGSLGIGPASSCAEWNSSRSVGSCSTTSTPKSKRRSVRR